MKVYIKSNINEDKPEILEVYDVNNVGGSFSLDADTAYETIKIQKRYLYSYGDDLDNLESAYNLDVDGKTKFRDKNLRKVLDYFFQEYYVPQEYVDKINSVASNC